MLKRRRQAERLLRKQKRRRLRKGLSEIPLVRALSLPGKSPRRSLWNR